MYVFGSNSPDFGSHFTKTRLTVTLKLSGNITEKKKEETFKYRLQTNCS